MERSRSRSRRALTTRADDRSSAIAAVTVKLERARRDLAELKLAVEQLHSSGHTARCFTCRRTLSAGARRRLRAALQASMEALEVDARYFEQRLAHLGQ